MGRPPRPQIAGNIYHLTARGNGRAPLFLEELDRHVYLRCLDRACMRAGALVLSYCLMRNHVHLILETPRANVAQAMHHVGSNYARRFNQRHRRTGHVFEARYHDVVIGDDRQFAAALAYVAMNPVQAGICDDPLDWRWSAHGALAGVVLAPAFLARNRALELVGGTTEHYLGLFAAT